MNEDELVKDFTELQIECSKLKKLLKECKEEFSRINCGYDVCSGDFEDIIDKIKDAIGESEER